MLLHVQASLMKSFLGIVIDKCYQLSINSSLIRYEQDSLYLKTRASHLHQQIVIVDNIWKVNEVRVRLAPRSSHSLTESSFQVSRINPTRVMYNRWVSSRTECLMLVHLERTANFAEPRTVVVCCDADQAWEMERGRG